MKWFKHQSDLRYDAKIRRLISKHGVAGYGVYNFALEAITEHLDTDSPIPELEDTSTDIAEYLHMDTLKVEEIILFCLNQGLFEQSETTGRILCNKVYKYIDKASTRSLELREMIKNYQLATESTSVSVVVRDCPRQTETVLDKADRTEQNRTESKRAVFAKPTLVEVTEYCKERKNSIDSQHFIDHYESNGWIVGKTKMKNWKAAIRTWENRSKEFNQSPKQEDKPFKFDFTLGEE